MMRERLLFHLENLVGLYPISSNQNSVADALAYVQKVLTSTKCFRDITLHENGGFHSLTASTQNTKLPKVLLQSHIDVVPAKPELQTLIQRDDDLIGRGVFDMLFAIASYLTFVEDQGSALKGLDLGLMITGDEELGGFKGVAALLEQGYGCEVCVLPDAGKGFGDLNVAAKGVFGFDLVVHGKAHHGSRPWEGDGAANKLVQLLHKILQLFDHSIRENSTLTIARLQSGDADNKGPSEAVARLDIRYRDDEDYRLLRKQITELAKNHTAELQRFDLGDDYKLDLDNDYVQQFLAMYREKAGTKITLGKAHGSSDARFFSAKGIPVIMLRPDGFGAHSDEERLSLSSFVEFHELLEEYILKTAKIKDR